MEPVRPIRNELPLTGICEKHVFVSPEGRQIDCLVPVEGGESFFLAVVRVQKQLPGGPVVTAERPYIIDGETVAKAFENQPAAEAQAAQDATAEIDKWIQEQRTKIQVPGAPAQGPSQMAKKVLADLMRERMRGGGNGDGR